VTLVCDDQPGIVHAVTGAIVEAEGNITELQQFSSLGSGRFFLRLQTETHTDRDQLRGALAPVIARYGMDCRVDLVGRPLRTLVLVSKAAHCLNDLLFRQRSGHLPIEIPLVLGNHPNLAQLAAFYDVPFESRAVTSAEEKAAFEARILEVVEQHDVELVVLARYMQILSPELCAALAGRAINIHHSFLPGFTGANPYARAHARGVKLIGATAHFVTSDLDEGPIIEQDVERVSHADTPEDLIRKGRDIERRVLARAVAFHLSGRVLLNGATTVVFRN